MYFIRLLNALYPLKYNLWQINRDKFADRLLYAYLCDMPVESRLSIKLNH